MDLMKDSPGIIQKRGNEKPEKKETKVDVGQDFSGNCSGS